MNKRESEAHSCGQTSGQLGKLNLVPTKRERESWEVGMHAAGSIVFVPRIKLDLDSLSEDPSVPGISEFSVCWSCVNTLCMCVCAWVCVCMRAREIVSS